MRGHTHKRNNLFIAIALNLKKADHFLPHLKAILSRARKIVLYQVRTTASILVLQTNKRKNERMETKC